MQNLPKKKEEKPKTKQRNKTAQHVFHNRVCTLKFVITMAPNHDIPLFYRTARNE